MKRIVRSTPLPGLALLVALAAPVAAQSHRVALTVTGGRSTSGDLSPGIGTPTVLQPGWTSGLQVEGWLGAGRLGLRLNGQYGRRALADAPGRYSVLAGDLDVMVRLLSPHSDRWIAPYVTIGAGATRYAAADSSGPIADGAYGDDPVRIHGLAGAGVDVAVAPRTGLRLEVVDQVVLPSVGESPPSTGLPTTHNLAFTAGLQLRLGSIWGQALRRRPRARREAVAPRASAPAADPRPAAVPARFTIQLGTFMDGPTADWWIRELDRRGIPAWRVSLEAGGRQISRVRVGAFPSEAEAEAMMNLLRSDYQEGVRVDPIRENDRPPADAVDATRVFLASR